MILFALFLKKNLNLNQHQMQMMSYVFQQTINLFKYRIAYEIVIKQEILCKEYNTKGRNFSKVLIRIKTIKNYNQISMYVYVSYV